MRKMLCLLLLLLLPACVLAEESPYRGDGQSMVTVLAETPLMDPDGEKILRVAAGARMIATDESAVGSSGELWCGVYLPGVGYGYVLQEDVRADAPQQLAYRPGFAVSAALFTVADPAACRVEVVSLDQLEYPVIRLTRVFSRQLEDGSWQLLASFDCAADVCKTTRETLIATLYAPDGEPAEVRMLIFDAPLWR